MTKKAAFAPRDGAGALVFIVDEDVVDRRLESRRQEALSAHLQQRGLELHATARLDAGKAEHLSLDRTFDSKAAHWEGRHTAGYVVFKDRMWIVGGDVEPGALSRRRVEFRPTARPGSLSLPTRQAVPWGPRALHYTVASSRTGSGSSAGKRCPHSPARRRSSIATLGVAGRREWEQVEPKEPYWSARHDRRQRVFKDRIWILGGGTYDTPKVTPDAKLLQRRLELRRRRAWTRHVETGAVGAAAVPRGRGLRRPCGCWKAIQRGKGNRNDVWHSADGVNWYELPTRRGSRGTPPASSVHDNALWMVAGNNMESDVWKLVRK